MATATRRLRLVGRGEELALLEAEPKQSLGGELRCVSSLGGDKTPAAAYGVFAPWELVAILLAGVIVAVGAAMLPGRWAARTNVVEVLHAE